MQTPCAILLLHLKDQRADPFPKSFAERLFTSAGAGTGNIFDYFREVSHGRADLSGSEVHGWYDLEHSMAELTEYTAAKQKEFDSWTQAERDADPAYVNKARRQKIVEWGEEAAAADGVDLSRFTVAVLVYSDNVDYFGREGRAVVNFNRADPTMFSLDLTGIAHEMGHAFGLPHSRLRATTEEYGDDWDIMSAYAVYETVQPDLPAGIDPKYQRAGPGLNAANMDLLGWLDETRVWSAGNGTVTLRPIHRADLPGYLAATLGSIYVEFRTEERWDASGGNAGIFLHQIGAHPESGRLCSYLIDGRRPNGKAARKLREGDTWQRGSELDIYSDFMKLAVTRIDADAREADVEFTLRIARRPPMEFGHIFVGGVQEDGGGWIFVPGKGLVPVPPRSPILHLLEDAAEMLRVDELTIPALERAQLSDRAFARMQRRISAIAQARTEYHVPAPPRRIGDRRREQ